MEILLILFVIALIGVAILASRISETYTPTLISHVSSRCAVQ